MLRLDTDKLTKLEKEVHGKVSGLVAENDRLKIIEAAEICEVSPSKVSTLVRKLGFSNFKQYKLYFSGQQVEWESEKRTEEIERLMLFLENFDKQIVDDFVSIYHKFNKIIIYGLGPSFISAEYFAYKLDIVSDKKIKVTHSEDYAEQMVDEDTLLIVLSVTGKFSSFETLFQKTKEKNAEIMLILEEYVNTQHSLADYVFHLSKFNQSDELLPFEKTRTIFFIFMEEIAARLRQGG
ncbi:MULTISPECIES: MurR/RpiR family transcriptional regulator [Pontibacillus]|uniref:SIS domain-containing protein n=1 Tax=Pontibacillus chungwhensis TaxID=265426 RepID=A0ABY8UWI5_9BACI|nr:MULTISPECIES: SIS domain-containing protein [Pontibacillus]MCD5324245.1 SIS domain-containing protein [Pontibacillus sp. HN14]WIF97700.1 SIS domain-containing protein [Pontibacillus chungwhensis]